MHSITTPKTPVLALRNRELIAASRELIATSKEIIADALKTKVEIQKRLAAAKEKIDGCAR